MRIKTTIYGLLISLSLFSCGGAKMIQTSNMLSPGMNKSEVIQIMGQPVVSEFNRDVEEWHYCAIGSGSDTFVALFFYKGELIEKTNYTVTIRDSGGATGHCRKFVKMGNYRTPDRVVEIRNR